MPGAQRFAPFGTTVFTEITDLAIRHDAINLGQGFPNFDGPDFVKDAAARAMKDGKGQYARSSGVVELVEAIARRFAKDSGLEADPMHEVTVTSGCTEALAAAMLALVDPGDEVVVIEPFYDAYPADVAMAGGVARYVTLRAPEFRLDPGELAAAFSDRTRVVLFNTPHNPTGRVLDRSELEAIAALCRRHDVIAVADEVYEHMIYDGQHLSIATLPGMWERTLTLSSLGKTFSLTGWKVGWAIGPAELSAAFRRAHQFLTFATATPLQWGAVAALAAPQEYYDQLVLAYRDRRDLLADGLVSLGFDVFVPQGTYFLMADHRAFGQPDDVSFVRHLISTAGVAAIPPSAFHSGRDGDHLVRFAFCKDIATLGVAVDRMGALTR